MRWTRNFAYFHRNLAIISFELVKIYYCALGSEQILIPMRYCYAKAELRAKGSGTEGPGPKGWKGAGAGTKGDGAVAKRRKARCKATVKSYTLLWSRYTNVSGRLALLPGNAADTKIHARLPACPPPAHFQENTRNESFSPFRVLDEIFRLGFLRFSERFTRAINKIRVYQPLVS